MEDWKTVFRYFLHDSGRYKFGGKSKQYFSNDQTFFTFFNLFGQDS